jgi:hypothetical protein
MELPRLGVDYFDAYIKRFMAFGVKQLTRSTAL